MFNSINYMPQLQVSNYKKITNSDTNFENIVDRTAFDYPNLEAELDYELMPNAFEIVSDDNLEGYSLNKEIENGTSQGTNGDCWLLSSLNSLSQTETGRKAIKDSMTIHKDGAVTITFKGANKSYYIPQEEILAGTIKEEHVEGDNDMIAFELATEQLYEDILNGKIIIDTDKQKYWEDAEKIKKDKEEHDSTIWAGYGAQFLNLLTGKEVNMYYKKKDINETLNRMKREDLAVTVSFKEEKELTDINNKKIKLYGNHAYSVIGSNKKWITVANPWDSGEHITIPREKFCEEADWMDVCYLNGSDENNLSDKPINDDFDICNEPVEKENKKRKKTFWIYTTKLAKIKNKT